MFFAVPSAAVSGKGNFAVGGNASFLPSPFKTEREEKGYDFESSLLVLVPSHVFLLRS